MAAEDLDRVARAIVQHRSCVALTGAGISVESGVPDFRSTGGLWERFNPMEYATIAAFRADPHRVWQMLFELAEILAGAVPNSGHRALARLEQLGLLQGIITQNVDGLHQDAGSQQVVEFHGSGRSLTCLSCGVSLPEDKGSMDRSAGAPICKCGAVLKPNVIFFGEQIPPGDLARAKELGEACAVMLIVGTSATVSPASMLPAMAQQHGALLVEFNLESTEITPLCDVSFPGSASTWLPRLVERVEQLLK